MSVPASRYREIGPGRLPATVRDVVECAWQARVPAGGHRQRVLPDGCMDLLVVDGRIVVAGPDTAAHVADHAAGTAVTGLRFRPGALPGLLGVPADALRDIRADLADVGARPAPTAGTTRSEMTRSGITPVEMTPSGPRRSPQPAGPHLGGDDLGWLVGVVASARSGERGGVRLPAPLPRPALHALARGMPAAELADRLGVTVRTLHRRCVATLGYGPSTARRVLRFRAATGWLFDGVAPAEAAARAGYADQPHLSREIRALAGVSPTELVAAPPM